METPIKRAAVRTLALSKTVCALRSRLRLQASGHALEAQETYHCAYGDPRIPIFWSLGRRDCQDIEPRIHRITKGWGEIHSAQQLVGRTQRKQATIRKSTPKYKAMLDPSGLPSWKISLRTSF